MGSVRNGCAVARHTESRRQYFACAFLRYSPRADGDGRARRLGLPPNRLELEITETNLLQNSAATLLALHQLRDIGVRIAMDDFGTGYSSLSYLQSFPFDKIKIDRSFVEKITEDRNPLNIVRAVAALANGLDMASTAEGVETVEQLARIKAEGYTEGYLISKPLPAHEVAKMLGSQRVQPKAA